MNECVGGRVCGGVTVAEWVGGWVGEWVDEWVDELDG